MLYVSHRNKTTYSYSETSIQITITLLTFITLRLKHSDYFQYS